MEPEDRWQRVVVARVGGVVAVAVPDERRVVVGSHSGLAVFDSVTGERALRVQDEDSTWFDEDRLAIQLPAAGGSIDAVPSMGLHGGVLPSSTPDGWRCERSNDGAELSREGLRQSVVDPEEFRAMGFSPAGSVFVLATSPSLTIMRLA